MPDEELKAMKAKARLRLLHVKTTHGYKFVPVYDYRCQSMVFDAGSNTIFIDVKLVAGNSDNSVQCMIDAFHDQLKGEPEEFDKASNQKNDDSCTIKMVECWVLGSTLYCLRKSLDEGKTWTDIGRTWSEKSAIEWKKQFNLDF